MSDADRLMTLQDVADYCDIPEMVVHRWITKRKLTVCFLPDGQHRFRLIDVRAAMESHRHQHSSTTFILGGLRKRSTKTIKKTTIIESRPKK